MTREEANKERALKVLEMFLDKQCSIERTLNHMDTTDVEIWDAVYTATKALSAEPCDDYAIGVDSTGRFVKASEVFREPCEDTISRAWIKEAIHNFYYGLKHTPTEEDIQAYIDAAPSVTPKQKMGRWVTRENPVPFEYPYSCNQCTINFFFKTPFCPNCGAKMESEDTE